MSSMLSLEGNKMAITEDKLEELRLKQFIEHIHTLIDHLEPFNRVKVFDRYCTHCGDIDTGCRCWDCS